MFNIGDIVIKKQTVVNGRVEENNQRRLSVVLFTENLDGNEILCTCPITSTYKSAVKSPDNYCHIAYLIYDRKRLSMVKINDVSFCDVSGVTGTGLKVDNNQMTMIYNKINSFEPAEELKYVYENIKDHISEINFSNIEKSKKKEAKMLRKEKKRMAKRMDVSE